MNASTHCERPRMTLMASLDGESGPRTAQEQQHLSTCAPCRRWLENLGSMTRQLQGLSYQSAPVDLWTAVEGQIRHFERSMAVSRRLWPIGALVLGWRALQLFIDLPIPVLHPLVPLAAAVAVVWLVAGDLLTIETSAPELQKRGV